MMPGMKPAMRRAPMDCSVMMPYMIMIKLGGMREARVPLAATTPAASFGS